MNTRVSYARAGHRTAVLAAALLVAICGWLAVAPTAHAVTVVAPEAGKHFPWTTVRPVVAITPGQGDKPKWVLVASDAAMEKTVRYCRQWVWVWQASAWRWGCSAYAVGADAWGRDIQRPLQWGTTYYWTVVYTDATGAEKRTPVRAFRIDDQPVQEDPSDISDRIFDSVIGDGSNLNKGAAAFSNSGVRVRSIKSVRVKPNRFRIEVTYQGNIRMNASYVSVRSKAGIRYIRLTPYGKNKARAIWKRSAAERRVRPAQYTYQAHVRSQKNNALVVSQRRVILIRG